MGEGVVQADPLRETVKNYAPYVVPCLDMGFTSIETEDEPYLHSIPYMQFPVTAGGRIFTGERGFVPGINTRDDFWMQRCRDAWKQYQEDPSKLHTYSAWDAVPGNANARFPITRVGSNDTCLWWRKEHGCGWRLVIRRFRHPVTRGGGCVRIRKPRITP